jgi:hypothetical protein
MLIPQSRRPIICKVTFLIKPRPTAGEAIQLKTYSTKYCRNGAILNLLMMRLRSKSGTFAITFNDVKLHLI